MRQKYGICSQPKTKQKFRQYSRQLMLMTSIASYTLMPYTLSTIVETSKYSKVHIQIDAVIITYTTRKQCVRMIWNQPKTLVSYQIASVRRIYSRHMHIHKPLTAQHHQPFQVYIHRFDAYTSINISFILYLNICARGFSHSLILNQISILIYNVSNHCTVEVVSFHFHQTNQFTKILQYMCIS